MSFPGLRDATSPSRAPDPSGTGSPPAAAPPTATVPAFVPAVHTTFPPPRAPQPEPAPAPPPARTDPRISPRIRTPALPPVGLSQPGGSMAYATLRDISRMGACLARRGRLDLAEGAAVRLEIHLPDSDHRIGLPARVRWTRFAGVNTYVGLRFDRPLPAGDPLLRALTGAPA